MSYDDEGAATLCPAAFVPAATSLSLGLVSGLGSDGSGFSTDVSDGQRLRKKRMQGKG